MSAVEKRISGPKKAPETIVLHLPIVSGLKYIMAVVVAEFNVKPHVEVTLSSLRRRGSSKVRAMQAKSWQYKS